MTDHAHAPRAVERVAANLTGAYVAVAGVVLLNVAVLLEWATYDAPTEGGYSGYEADSLNPFMAYLGVGFAVALLYAAKRAYRNQHRGLSLASMAVGLAVFLQTVAWVLDVPGAAERSSELGAGVGVYLALVGSALWAIGSGLLAKEPEGDTEHDRVHAGTHDQVGGRTV